MDTVTDLLDQLAAAIITTSEMLSDSSTMLDQASDELLDAGHCVGKIAEALRAQEEAGK